LDLFQNNLNLLHKRFPKLASTLEAISLETIAVAKSQDGAFCYAQNTETGWQPFTNPIDPVAKAKAGIALMEKRLLNGFSPAVVVGLWPGMVLDSVYKHFASRLERHEPFRRIYVIIDSLPCLVGWLKSADKSDILKRDEIEFYHINDIDKIVQLCEQDVQRSHLFVPVSELAEAEINRKIEPLAQLYLKRQEELKHWQEDNNNYYNNLDDNKLAEVIQGNANRKPKLLMPTHSASTVVQYSTRDTCAMFEKMGWETKILKINRDLSPWLLTKTIHDFKPDVLLYINYLRIENQGLELFPKNLMYITWIQDAMPYINRSDTAQAWNEAAKDNNRDLIIGYTDQLRKYNYLEDRLVVSPMVVNTDIFKPIDLTEEQKEKYTCDVCYASNRSKPTDKVVEENLYPALSKFDFTVECFQEINSFLWKEYRNEKTFTNYNDLLEAISSIKSFYDIYEKQTNDDKDNIIQKIHWELNDIIYRHVVLEWISESGVKLNLYGRGWEKHPTLSKHAKGIIKHESELSTAYQAAKYCLHLNSIEGSHQRILEILASEATPLTRYSNTNNLQSPDLLNAFQKISTSLFLTDNTNQTSELSDTEEMQLNDQLFAISQSILNKEPDISLEELEIEALKNLEHVIANNPIWLVENWYDHHFTSRQELLKILK
jgi:hypothetical protein